MNFTDVLLKKAKGRDKPYVLNEGRGFILMVLPSGTRTFYIRYTFNGKEKKKALGIYPDVSLADARERYNDAVKSLKMGVDPGAPVVAPAPVVQEEDVTVEWIANKYIDWSSENHGTDWHSVVRITARKHVIPTIGKRHILSIRKRDAIELMESIDGGGAARNALKVVQGIFKYAIQRGYIDTSPFVDLAAAVPALKAQPRKRTLNDKEVHTVWGGLSQSHPNICRALKLILVTAQRPGEVIGMHTREIEGDWWTIPSERTKNRLEHRVFLTATAKILIGDKKGFIFTGASDERPLTERTLPQTVTAKYKYFGLERWTPHDLRRTARTAMARIGVLDEHGEAVVNHAKVGVIGTYNLYKYDKEKREVLLKWEAELLRIIEAPQPTA